MRARFRYLYLKYVLPAGPNPRCSSLYAEMQIAKKLSRCRTTKMRDNLVSAPDPNLPQHGSLEAIRAGVGGSGTETRDNQDAEQVKQ